VQVFRRFRDQVLLPTTPGRVLVNLYYTISPPTAHRLGEQHWLTRFIRRRALEPLAKRLH